MGDRPFVAFQLDRVPNKFWGRGVAEKGYNPQKALDAELRARIDALALTTHPMMGVDATRLPRGVKFEVKAGKTILTNGDPRTTLFPLNFGTLAQSTFTEAAELERMVQMGTGAMDSATGRCFKSKKQYCFRYVYASGGINKASEKNHYEFPRKLSYTFN